MKRDNPETKLQISFLSWLKLQYPYLWEVTYHPKNEGSQKWNKAKMGNSAGILDIIIDHAAGSYHGFRMELKSDERKLSVNQKMWMENLKEEGYYVCWVNNLDDAMHHVKRYVNCEK